MNQTCLLAAVLLGLTACGGGGSPDTRSTPAPSAAIKPPALPVPPHAPTPSKRVFTEIIKVTPPTPEQQLKIHQVVAGSNRLRAEQKLPPLQYDPELSAYAQKRAEEIVRLTKHARPGEKEGEEKDWDSGLQGTYLGENYTAGSAAADDAVRHWRNSPKHYENIIDQNYTRIGVGLVYVPDSRYKYYWVQIFGNDTAVSEYSFNPAARPPAPAPKPPAAPDDKLAVLHIDGQTVPLTVAGDGDWHAIDAGGYQGVFGGNTAFVRYGIIRQNGQNAYRAFYQGVPTPTERMPAEGKANYRGYGIAARGNDQSRLNAEFTADFGNKKLDGSLTDAKQRFNIKADIRGNAFASPKGAALNTQGSFFGNDADELSGMFTGQGVHGAFGASRPR